MDAAFCGTEFNPDGLDRRPASGLTPLPQAAVAAEAAAMLRSAYA
jgi:hypothetical protein